MSTAGTPPGVDTLAGLLLGITTGTAFGRGRTGHVLEISAILIQTPDWCREQSMVAFYAHDP